MPSSGNEWKKEDEFWAEQTPAWCRGRRRCLFRRGQEQERREREAGGRVWARWEERRYFWGASVRQSDRPSVRPCSCPSQHSQPSQGRSDDEDRNEVSQPLVTLSLIRVQSGEVECIHTTAEGENVALGAKFTATLQIDTTHCPNLHSHSAWAPRARIGSTLFCRS